MIVNKIEESRAATIMYKIADILAMEFANQIALGNTFLPDTVDVDYIHATDAAKMPFVGVMYSDSEYQNEAQSQSQAISKYVIECKANSYSDARKIAEVVRAILKNSQYNTLELPSNFGIMGTQVNTISMTIFEQRMSTQNNTTAYVVFEVRHHETTEKLEGTPLVMNSTKVTRDDGTLYYVYNLT